MNTFLKLWLVCFSFIFMLLACNKKKNSDSAASDKTNPVLTLKGDADMVVSLGSNTPDPGANAVDNKDGDLSASVSSDWNTALDQNKTGSYTVTYSVSDKAGNKGNATRKVTVKSTAGNLLGAYNAVLSTSFGSSPVGSSTVTAGANPSEIIVYPVYLGYYLHANLTGLLNENLTFDWNDQGGHFVGTGSISNGGKNITLTGTLTTATAAQSFTQTLSK